MYALFAVTYRNVTVLQTVMVLRSPVYPVMRFFLSLANALAASLPRTRSMGVQENVDATRLRDPSSFCLV